MYIIFSHHDHPIFAELMAPPTQRHSHTHTHTKLNQNEDITTDYPLYDKYKRCRLKSTLGRYITQTFHQLFSLFPYLLFVFNV